MCFTVQLSKIGFALPFVSNSFAIISCRFLPVKNFFQLFWSCFCFSLAATLISYHIQPAVVKNFFHFFLTALWSLWDLSDATLIGYHCIHGLSTVIFMFFYFFANNQNIRFFMSFIPFPLHSPLPVSLPFPAGPDLPHNRSTGPPVASSGWYGTFLFFFSGFPDQFQKFSEDLPGEISSTPVKSKHSDLFCSL